MTKLYSRSAPALALTLVLQQAHALDVHGIRIGDPWDPEKLEQRFSYPTVPTSQRVKCAGGGDETCVGTTRYLDCDVRLTIEGKDGRVRKMTMTLPTDQFESEVSALKREFGQPTDDWSAPATATAPLLFHRRVDWRLPKEELLVLKFSAMAVISLTTPEESLAHQYPPPM